MRVILFGASLGGQNFIKNHLNDYEYLAIADNDKNKHGLFIKNIEIVDPTSISSYTYDQIIVASMYVESITEQLQKLGVPKHKIKYASKNSMKVDLLPFEDETILAKANNLIAHLSNILKELPHFYTFGTLLGIVRDGRLIPWDDDIDIAIFEEHTEQIARLLIENVHLIEKLFEVKLYKRIYTNGKCASLTMDCFANNKKLFMVNFDCIVIDGDVAKQELNDTPKAYFEKASKITFHDIQLSVPNNFEEYLTYTYGEWQTVKKNTSFADNTISFREPIYGCKTEYLYESK